MQEQWQFKLACLLHALFCFLGVVYSLYKGSEEIAKHKNNVFAAEEAREAGGLSIIVSWLLMSLMIDSKKIQNMTRFGWIKVVSLALLPFLSALVWMYTVDIEQGPMHCQTILRGIQSYL